LATPIKDALYRFRPLRSLARFVVNRFVPKEFTEIEISDGNLKGYRLLVDLKSEKRFWLGIYEAELQEAIQRFVKKGMIAYDVGANVGFTALLLSQAVGQTGQVVAFEPLPINAIRLRKNLAINGVEHQARVVECAVTDFEKKLSFLAYKWSGMGHIQGLRKIKFEPQESIEVEGITLDHFVFREGNAPPDFIKIDVEGAEANVLRGGKRLLDEVKPLMILELHTPQTSADVLEILTIFGYQFYELGNRYDEVTSVSVGKEPVRLFARHASKRL
jgi:FkbM family methyltransferase